MTMRCHSVFSWRCSSASVHHVFVASERMASLRPDFFVILLSGFFPKKPINSTRFSYIFFTSVFCPRNGGTKKRGGDSRSERLLYGRDPCGLARNRESRRRAAERRRN